MPTHADVLHDLRASALRQMRRQCLVRVVWLQGEAADEYYGPFPDWDMASQFAENRTATDDGSAPQVDVSIHNLSLVGE